MESTAITGAGIPPSPSRRATPSARSLLPAAVHPRITIGLGIVVLYSTRPRCRSSQAVDSGPYCALTYYRFPPSPKRPDWGDAHPMKLLTPGGYNFSMKYVDLGKTGKCARMVVRE